MSRVDEIAQERDEALKECREQARLLGMGAERELKLVAERDEARALAVKLADALELTARMYERATGLPMPSQTLRSLQDPRLARIRLAK